MFQIPQFGFFLSLLNVWQCCFCFLFCFFSHKACRPGIEPVPPALEGEVSTTGSPGKPPLHHFLLWLHTILVYGYTIFFHPFICWWTLTCFHFFWLSGIVLSWTWVYLCLSKSLFSVPWGVYLEVKLWPHTVILCLIFLKNYQVVLNCFLSPQHLP